MTDYILQLSYDLRQVTQSLKYQFCTPQGDICSMLEAGPLASSYNFQAGDRISIQVMALSAMNEDKNNPPSHILKSVHVSDCALLSIGSRLNAALSMFDENTASQHVTNWTLPKEIPQPGDADENLKRLCWGTKSPLKVVSEKGQWQLSGYLSVAMNTADGNQVSRLYYFDPESSTGSAGGWG